MRALIVIIFLKNKILSEYSFIWIHIKGLLIGQSKFVELILLQFLLVVIKLHRNCQHDE